MGALTEQSSGSHNTHFSNNICKHMQELGLPAAGAGTWQSLPRRLVRTPTSASSKNSVGCFRMDENSSARRFCGHKREYVRCAHWSCPIDIMRLVYYVGPETQASRPPRWPFDVGPLHKRISVQGELALAPCQVYFTHTTCMCTMASPKAHVDGV